MARVSGNILPSICHPVVGSTEVDAAHEEVKIEG